LRTAASIWRLGVAMLMSGSLTAHGASDHRLIDDPVYTAPSRLVELADGRRLNLHCTGSGRPVVVFESGLGDSTKAWGLVQPELSQQTRSCSYDRAALGFSDGAETSRNAANAVQDLRALLNAAGEQPPFVLVGHSYGGMIVKLFAFSHPRDVAGVVLVDPSHEDVGRELFEIDPESLQRNIGYLESLQSCIEAPAFPADAASDLSRLCVAEAGPAYSDAIRSADRLLATKPHRIAAWVSEMRSIWRESADQVRNAARPLGNTPVVVLTKAPSPPAANETPELRARKNAVLSRQHDETVALSSKGVRMLVEGTGHYIQLDHPSAVIDAIRSVLREVAADNPADAF
jgi:pimeloyl-ACP methyl ester carboxylesterase